MYSVGTSSVTLAKGMEDKKQLSVWAVAWVSLDNHCLQSVNWESLQFSVILATEHRSCLHTVTLGDGTGSSLRFLESGKLPPQLSEPDLPPSLLSTCGRLLSRFLLARVWPFSVGWFLFLSPLVYTVDAVLAFLSPRIKTLSQQRFYLPNPSPFQLICFYSCLNTARYFLYHSLYLLQIYLKKKDK